MKRTKAAVAPDAPPKQMAAWTVQGQTLGPDQVIITPATAVCVENFMRSLSICMLGLSEFTSFLDTIRLFASVLIVIQVWGPATRLRLGSACLATRVQNTLLVRMKRHARLRIMA